MKPLTIPSQLQVQVLLPVRARQPGRGEREGPGRAQARLQAARLPGRQALPVRQRGVEAGQAGALKYVTKLLLLFKKKIKLGK